MTALKGLIDYRGMYQSIDLSQDKCLHKRRQTCRQRNQQGLYSYGHQRSVKDADEYPLNPSSKDRRRHEPSRTFCP